MKILSVGSDRKLFDPVSAVNQRVRSYAEATDGYLVLIPGRGKFPPTRLSPKLRVISLGRWRAFFWHPREFFDLVTAQDPFENGLAAWFLAKRLGARLELQIHTDLFSPYFTRFSLLNKIRIILAKFLLPRASQIRVVSDRIKRGLIEKLKIENSKITTRPIFVDTEKIKNAPIKTDLHQKYPQFDKIILMASRLTKEKNIELAIAAMPEILKHQPRTGLIIVGSGPEEQKLRLLASSLELSENIIFEGWCDDLFSYYKTADLFLNTSWYEGYGMTLVEAKAAGCLVVSTDVGVAKEVGATIIPHEDAKIAAQIILKTLV